MRKIAIRALAAAVLITSAAPAFADYWSRGHLYCTYGYHYYYDTYGNLWYECE
jgi:hypothetical protein